MVEARAGAGNAAANQVRMKCAAQALVVGAAPALRPYASPREQPDQVRATRPDLGIRGIDARLKDRAPGGILDGLSSAAAPGGTLFLEGSSGRTVTSTKIAALAAPADLRPIVAKVQLGVRAGAAIETPQLAVGDVITPDNVFAPAAVKRR